MLTWLHFGDLHVTTANETNYRDLKALVADANAHLASGIDFAVLPGDNADDGTVAQFGLVKAAMEGLTIDLHVIPGDHDFKPCSLDAYYRTLAVEQLPKAITIKNHRCLFLDIVSAGSGGPDFRLGADQTAWLERELIRQTRDGRPVVVFMHAYPGDLHEHAPEIGNLFARHRVAFVDTGHTHYNELLNDGTTIYAATRSIGQIEEGPVGFAITTLDHGVTNWRFKPLAAGWPFVMITSPADHRLITNPQSPFQIVRGPLQVRAKAWGEAGIRRVTLHTDNGIESHMAPVAEEPGVWMAHCPSLEDGRHKLMVTAEDAYGRTDQDSISALVSGSGAYETPGHDTPGFDSNTLGAWPEKGIHGGQLGPNKNGKKW